MTTDKKPGLYLESGQFIPAEELNEAVTTDVEPPEPIELEERPVRGTGLVNAIGITALAVAAACALSEIWRAFV